MLVSSQIVPPRGYRLNARQAERIAFAVGIIRATVRHHRGAYPAEYTRGPGWWQVSWFTRSGKEIAQVYIYDATGKVVQAWTGFQVAWTMARGYPGAFGRRVNAPVRVAAAVPAVPRPLHPVA